MNYHSGKQELQELCIYLLFLTVATIISMAVREIDMYYFNHTINKLFLDGISLNEENSGVRFAELATIEDFWLFASTTFIKGICQSTIGGNLTIGGSIFFGVPRLRQIRVKSELCEVSKIFKNNFEICFGPYTKREEDKRPFLNFKHTSQSDDNTYSVSGHVTNYQGSGYIQLLTLSREKNFNILRNLKDKNWIDVATRVILLEFVLFNANVNLFCHAKLLTELPPTGGIHTSSHVHSLKYHPLWNDNEYFVPICLLILLVIVLQYIYKATRCALAEGCRCFQFSIFHIIDFIIILITCFAVVYILWHVLHLKSILSNYKADSEQYQSLDVICFWNSIFLDTMGIFIFITWIRMFKYIKFNKNLMQFSCALNKCAKDLLSFSMFFLVIFVAYALLSVLWFGSVNSSFKTLLSAILTLMRTVLGDFDYSKMEASNRVLGPVFFLSFLFFVFFILINIFLAIINETYSNVKSEKNYGQFAKLEEYLKYLFTQLKKFVTSRKHDTVLKEHREEKKEKKLFIQSILSFEENRRTRQILDKYFEVLSTKEVSINNALAKRINSMEWEIYQIVYNIDDILARNGSSSANN